MNSHENVRQYSDSPAARYFRKRSRAIAYGTWHPWADAEPVRAHLHCLLDEHGMLLSQVAALAGTARDRLQAILTGPPGGTEPQRRVRPALAAAVLAVRPVLDGLPDALLVNAAGTRRRLQALVFAGWPQSRLADRLGMTPGNFGLLLGQQRVTARTARAVTALYDSLWRQDPRDHGVSKQAYNRARNHASRAGWQPVGAWDDDTIDVPTTAPAAGVRRLRAHSGAEAAA